MSPSCSDLAIRISGLDVERVVSTSRPQKGSRRYSSLKKSVFYFQVFESWCSGPVQPTSPSSSDLAIRISGLDVERVVSTSRPQKGSRRYSNLKESSFLFAEELARTLKTTHWQGWRTRKFSTS
ncbi:hypothetical protein C7M84_013559 [Penaeus vannamei]|uniref:Uncharacterized protein n=1 Tax=Penaeus vannamei TaxID=6689 RepID=A0A423SVZ8_PENVA|nr:hypothetical protein C7M84_013559 [Penaeus vannamei]